MLDLGWRIVTNVLRANRRYGLPLIRCGLVSVRTSMIGMGVYLPRTSARSFRVALN